MIGTKISIPEIPVNTGLFVHKLSYSRYDILKDVLEKYVNKRA
jgi:hypothetical protein